MMIGDYLLVMMIYRNVPRDNDATRDDRPALRCVEVVHLVQREDTFLLKTPSSQRLSQSFN